MKQELEIINTEMDYTREKLISSISSLIRTLENELRLLKKDDKYYPNSLGVIQGNALNIDLNCARLYILKECKELIDTNDKL